jgi:hypothetical protein
MEDIHKQVDMHGRRYRYIIWGKGIQGESVFAGGDVYNL